MRLGQKLLMSVAIGFAFTSSAGAAQDIPFSGFFGNPTVYEQLQPGPKGGAKLRWLKGGVDPKKYDKFMVDSVTFFLADNADYKGIDPQEMKELADALRKWSMPLKASTKSCPSPVPMCCDFVSPSRTSSRVNPATARSPQSFPSGWGSVSSRRGQPAAGQAAAKHVPSSWPLTV